MSIRCIHCQKKLSPPFQWWEFLKLSIYRSDPLLPLDKWLCSGCRNQIEWLEGECCPLCSRRLSKLEPAYIKSISFQDVCYDCYRWKEWEQDIGLGSILEYNKSAVVYNLIVQEWMEQYKFRRDVRLKYFLATLMLEKVSQQLRSEPVDVLVPIPLSATRLLERGFNQSTELAVCIAPVLQAHVGEDILSKRADDLKQSKKDRESRLTEMLKKFLKNSQTQVDIYNKRILLVDDIYTTGATLYAAAYVLRQAGAASVCSLTLAR